MSLDTILVVILLIVVTGMLLVGGMAFHNIREDKRGVTAVSRSLDDHPKYGPMRRAGIEGGKENQRRRNEQAELDIVNYHYRNTPKRWYRKAAKGSERHQELIDKTESLIQWDLRIFRNQISKGHRAAPRIHRNTGETTGGIRRVPYKRKSVTPRPRYTPKTYKPK